MSPTQFLAASFFLAIIIGTILLVSPSATVNGESLGLIDAFFTATSAVCVTGLMVVDTGTQLSLFGQIVIMCLVQAGGLGFMTMSVLVFLLMGKRITLKERLIMQEALNHFSMEGIVRLTKYVLTTTFIIESIGALILAFRFIPLFGWAAGIYYSIFHSISAFCNAGFDLIGHHSSLIDFSGDIFMNLTVMGLVIVGGLGFTVILDLNRHRLRYRKWSLQTKIVLAVTAFLTLAGFLFFFVVEFNNPDTLGHRPLGEKILAALFHSINTRTAGFNTVDIAGFTNASKFMMILLMFVGASPSSTGGGIKTTTFSLVMLMAITVIKGQNEITAFGRRISHATAARALTIVLISLLMLIGVTMILSLIEFVPFLDIMLQTASALSTAGFVSMDIAGLKNTSKLIIALTMFMGRVGPLTLTMAFARRQSKGKNLIRYPEERIMVG
jgi:trk system potassium uptake protein TrkH